MGYYKDLSTPWQSISHYRWHDPACNCAECRIERKPADTGQVLGIEATPQQRYRVAYRKSFSEQCQYEYFDTEGQAKAKFRALRQRGYFGACQFWNRIEQMWIG